MAYDWHVLVEVIVTSLMVLPDTIVLNAAWPTIMNPFDTSLDRALLVELIPLWESSS